MSNKEDLDNNNWDYEIRQFREAPATSDYDSVTHIFKVRVGRPSKEDFIRTHPSDDEFTIPCVPLLTYESDTMDRSFYWLGPDVQAMLAELGISASIKLVRLVTAISRRASIPFIWPITLPRESGSGRAWAVSALEIAEMAKTVWVKVVGDRQLGAYKAIQPLADLPDPDWGPLNLAQLVQLAFGDRRIDSVDHPVIRDLRGDL
jgi:hypothetical protein